MNIFNKIREFFDGFALYVKYKNSIKNRSDIDVPVKVVDVSRPPTIEDISKYYNFYVKKKKREISGIWTTEKVQSIEEYCREISKCEEMGINPWRHLISSKTDCFIGYPPEVFINVDGNNELIKGNLYKPCKK